MSALNIVGGYYSKTLNNPIKPEERGRNDKIPIRARARESHTTNFASP